jgi:hypothetical protein
MAGRVRPGLRAAPGLIRAAACDRGRRCQRTELKPICTLPLPDPGWLGTVLRSHLLTGPRDHSMRVPPGRCGMSLSHSKRRHMRVLCWMLKATCRCLDRWLAAREMLLHVGQAGLDRESGEVHAGACHATPFGAVSDLPSPTAAASASSATPSFSCPAAPSPPTGSTKPRKSPRGSWPVSPAWKRATDGSRTTVVKRSAVAATAAPGRGHALGVRAPHRLHLHKGPRRVAPRFAPASK